MAFDAFLKMDGIPGESRTGEIHLESFNFGVSNSGSSGTTGSGDGKSMFQDFSFATVVGNQTPKLFEAAAQGRTIHNAYLMVTDKTEPFMVHFTNVLISSYKIQEGAVVSQKCFEGDLPAVQRGAPTESVSFNFQKIDFQAGGSTTTIG